MSPLGPRILLVDDDPRTQELLADLIQGEGWVFDVADTVEEAKALLHTNDEDFMILVVEAAANRIKDLTGRDFGVMGFSMGA